MPYIDEWETLPADTRETCDKTPWGWSRRADAEDRCGKPAIVINKSTCNCGACDMSHRHCIEHDEERRLSETPPAAKA